MIAHIVHWVVAGSTISPIEPSEAMYTLNQGYLNAGAIFFAVAILATLLLGRFVCGWGCHLVAYQDFCNWLLRKMGIRPRQFRSRLLLLGPLALALYMFVWPTVYRWIIGAPRPQITNHLVTSDFWATFPGPVVAILTFAVCGFVIVYFLGAKGFCTYACPYGGFFAVADRAAPGRIRVTDDCEQCGHCTSVCTSNVRVHEEVARYGMVVDPGCMKCMDCVSVCPNDALYFGFGRPAVGAKPSSPNKTVNYDFTLREEGVMALLVLAGVLSFRGLYDQIPLLLAMALGALTAYVTMKFYRLLRTPNVRFQSWSLRHGGRFTRAGTVFAIAAGAWLIFTAHSAAVQYQGFAGRRALATVQLGDDVWLTDRPWWDTADAARRDRAARAQQHFERADRWGLMTSPSVLRDLVWLHVARGSLDAAEETVKRLLVAMPDDAESHRGLAGVYRRQDRPDAAVAAYRTALRLNPAHDGARRDLLSLLMADNRPAEAVEVYREAIEVSDHDTPWRLELGMLLMQMDDTRQGLAELQTAVDQAPESAAAHSILGTALSQTGEFQTGMTRLEHALTLEPDSAEVHYNLGMALLAAAVQQRDDDAFARAVGHLKRAVTERPEVAIARFNLAVALFMAGEYAEALPHIREAVRLDPLDPMAHMVLGNLLHELGDAEGAAVAREREAALRLDSAIERPRPAPRPLAPFAD